MDFDSCITTLFDEQIKFDYMVIDHVECTFDGNTPVYVGHLITNKLFKDYYIFKISEKKLLELHRVVTKINNSVRCNFIIEGNTVIYPKARRSQFINAEHSSKEILFKLDDCMEFTLFHLLAIVESLNGYIEIDSELFKVSNLKFSENRMSMYFVEKKQSWRSTMLLSYNLDWELRNFNIILPNEVDKLLNEYLLTNLKDCTYKSQDNSNLPNGYIRYHVNTELACPCPVDMSWVPALFSQETLLTVLSELKFSRIFMMGVNMFSSVMKELLDFNPIDVDQSTSYKSRSLASDVFRIKYDFFNYNRKEIRSYYLSEKLNLSESIMKYYTEETEEAVQEVRGKLNQLQGADYTYELFVNGFITAMTSSQLQYSTIVKACADIRKRVNERDIYKYLYYYLWRAIFQDNKSLVQTLFSGNPLIAQLNSYAGCEIDGGLYDEEFTLQ